MSDARLTVKVRLQAPSLADQVDTVAAPAPFSTRRIAAALLLCSLVLGAGYWRWAHISASQPEQSMAAKRILAQEGDAPLDRDDELAASDSAPATTAEQAPAGLSATAAVSPDSDSSAKMSRTAASDTAVGASAANGVQAHTASDGVLPTGFGRIILTDRMESLQPGAALGHQIRYPDIKRLYLFTELKGYAGQVLKHRWYYQGQLHTEAVLTIEDSPWRTYSENWLLDDQRGDWYVEIVDQAQNRLYRYDFHYQ